MAARRRRRLDVSRGHLRGRGTEHRFAALTLAALLVLGGLLGSINLFVDGVLGDGAQRWIYAATMAALRRRAIPLVVRNGPAGGTRSGWSCSVT